MVRMTVALVAAHPRGHQLVQSLRSLVAVTRLEPGCLTCTVWSDLESSVRYIEEWATELDVKRRIRSDPFSSVLAAMKRADEAPIIRFDFYTLSRGLDYVREIRQQPS
jgi:quinol monooxygenase YgiN